MKRLLLAFLLLAFFLPLTAQDVTYYAEDFDGGPNGWKVNTYLCEGTTGEYIGTYTLTSGTYNGNNIGGLDAELSIYTEAEYTLQFTHGPHFGYSQGQFLVENGKFNSSLTGATFDLDSTITSLEDNGHILYTSQLDISQEFFDQWGLTLTGAGSPGFVKSGNDVTITSTDGLTVLKFSKTSDCGQSWIWHPDGQVGYGFRYPTGTAIFSQTRTNGAMSLNADWLSSLGDVNNLPSGPPPGYESELISPSIDLSDAGGPVYLRFNEAMEYWPTGTPNSPTGAGGAPVITSVSYSVDGGQTWMDSIDINRDIKYLDVVGTNLLSLIPIETRFIELPEAAGQSDVKVKFNWTGTFYFWVIDDVSIQSAPESNLALGEIVWYPAESYQQPVSQIGLDTMGFFATVSNLGVKNMTNVGLRASVFDPDFNQVFRDSIVIDELPAGYLDSLLFIPGEYVPDVANTEDEYLVVYTLYSDSTDINFSDNTKIMFFRAHPDTYAKDNGFELFGSGLGSLPSDFQVGCYYELDPLAGNGFEAVSAYYEVFAITPLQSDAQIITNLYEVNEEVNAEFTDFDFTSTGDNDDLTVVAFGVQILPSEQNFGELTVDIGDIDGNKIPLKPGGRYFLTNAYAGANRALIHQFDNDITYYNNIFSLVKSILLFEDGRWYTRLGFIGQEGFEADSNVPVMHLTIQFNPTAIDEKPLPEAALNIYPNPTVEQLSVDVDLENRSPGLVIITDAAGNIKLWQKYESLQKETLNFNVKSYPAGNYFLRLGTEEGTKTLPFVVTGK